MKKILLILSLISTNCFADALFISSNKGRKTRIKEGIPNVIKGVEGEVFYVENADSVEEQKVVTIALHKGYYKHKDLTADIYGRGIYKKIKNRNGRFQVTKSKKGVKLPKLSKKKIYKSVLEYGGKEWANVARECKYSNIYPCEHVLHKVNLKVKHDKEVTDVAILMPDVQSSDPVKMKRQRDRRLYSKVSKKSKYALKCTSIGEGVQRCTNTEIVCYKYPQSGMRCLNIEGSYKLR
jgi:hypothetical protein